MAPPYRRPSELQIRYPAPPVVLDGPAPVAPEDIPQLLHASLQLVELLVQCGTQVLYRGGGQVGVHSPEVL